MKAEAARHDFYVYALLREDGVTPFYIGKGRGKRSSEHFSPSSLRRKSRKNAVIKKVLAACGRVPVSVFHERLTEFEAHEREREAIICLGRCDDRRMPGPLTNMTDGGEGTTGLVKTPEMRLAAHVASQRPEVRRAKSEGVRAVFADRERLDRRNTAIRASLQRPEVREKISQGVRAALASPETRAAISAARKAQAADPAWRERVAAATKAGIARKKAERAAL